MRYINILLIILLIIIISYILIILFNNRKKEEFTQSENDNTTEIPQIDNIKILTYNDNTIKFDKIIYDDSYDECDYKFCNFLYTDIIKDTSGDYKSIYITESNDIYYNLNNKNYIKTNIPIYEKFRITAITHFNNYEKIFVAVRLLDSEKNSIYYYDNNNWFKVDLLDLKNQIQDKVIKYLREDNTYIDTNKKKRISDWKIKLTNKRNDTYDTEIRKDLEEQINIILQEKHNIITSLDYNAENNKLIYSTYGLNRNVEYEEGSSGDSVSDIILITDLKIIEVDIATIYTNNKNIQQKLKYYYLDIGNENDIEIKNTIKTEIIADDCYIVLISNNINGVIGNDMYMFSFDTDSGLIYQEKLYENIKDFKTDYNSKIIICKDNTEKKFLKFNVSNIIPKNQDVSFPFDINEMYNFSSEINIITIFDDFGDEELEYIKDYYIYSNDIYILSNGDNIYYTAQGDKNQIDIPKEEIINLSKITVFNEKQIIIHSNKRIPFFYYDTVNSKVNIIYIDDNFDHSNIDSFDLNENISFYKYYNDALFKSKHNYNKLVFEGMDNLNLSYYINLTDDKYVDLLVVGGGGGGGYGGGGGGGGDIKMYKNLKMPKGNYKITVGSGGKGGLVNNNKEIEWQDGKELNIGGYGNNTFIEKIDYPDNFKKIVVVGGGGGGSDFKNIINDEITDLSQERTSEKERKKRSMKINTNRTKYILRTPIYGQIGKIEFSSGGGGGASGMHKFPTNTNQGSQGQRNDDTASMIGGHGNGISGDGGSSSIVNTRLYSGGGGGGGPILDRIEYKYFEVAVNLKHGEKSMNDELALGGEGVEINELYESLIDIKLFSKGGRGGFVGEIENYNTIVYKNKFKKISEFGYGYGGNGGVIILNNDLNNNEEIQGNNGDNGTPGIVIIYESEKKETESRVSPVIDPLLEQYRYSEENLEKRQRDVEKIYRQYIEDSLESKKMTEMTFVKNYNKNNVNQISEEAEKINMELALENQRNFREPINDIVRDTYLPYSRLEYDGNKDISEQGGNVDMNSPENNNKKYTIIRLFKELLYRNPTPKELSSYFRKIVNEQLDIKKLRNLIINSDEYRKVVNLQSNSVNTDIIYSNSKVNTINKISLLYFEELDEEIDNKLISPLKDIYIYFQFNDYLFRALIINTKFNDFKSQILESTDLNHSDIIDLLNQNYDMVELREKANNILRYDKYHKKVNTEKVLDPSSYTTKYDTFLEDNTFDKGELKDSLEDLILKDNYNYRLWNTDTQTDKYHEEDYNLLEDAYLDRIELRDSYDSTMIPEQQIDGFLDYPDKRNKNNNNNTKIGPKFYEQFGNLI